MSAVRVAAIIPQWNRRELLETLFRKFAGSEQTLR